MKDTSSGRLTLVGTPIGNLSDFSPRGVEALAACDFIAAEDTRVTLKLLNHFGITKPLVSYHEHNKRERGEQLCTRLLAGENGVLVSDAGMPAISDPGEDLVALCHQKGIPVGVVPGPTAVTTALALAGLPTRRFVFEGFLETNKKDRRQQLESLCRESRTVVLYEAPHRLTATLEELLTALGDRRIALVRELTKIHEEVVLTTLVEAVETYRRQEPRGEFVLILEGATPEAAKVYTPEEAVTLARAYVKEGMAPSEAAKRAAGDTGLKKGEIYRLLVE